MDDTVENLTLDLLEWLGRTEQETMDAWRTSCPRLSIWEDANERGFIDSVNTNGGPIIRVTPAGLAFLRERRQ